MEHKTKELLAGTTLPSSDLEEYNPPKCATFPLTQAELDECLPKFVPGKRMRLIKNWTSVFREHLLHVTPYTSLHVPCKALPRHTSHTKWCNLMELVGNGGES